MGRLVTINTDDLVNASTIAERLGYSSPSVVSNWAARYEETFPEPLYRTPAGQAQVYSWPEVARWFDMFERGEI